MMARSRKVRKPDWKLLLFEVPDRIWSIRTIWRLQQRWVEETGRSIQQMQKALTLMNVQLANGITDLSGQIFSYLPPLLGRCVEYYSAGTN